MCRTVRHATEVAFAGGVEAFAVETVEERCGSGAIEAAIVKPEPYAGHVEPGRAFLSLGADFSEGQSFYQCKEVIRKSSGNPHAKTRARFSRIAATNTSTGQLPNSQLESLAMPDTLRPPKTNAAAPGESPHIFCWPRQITDAELNSLLAGVLSWMLDALDVMLY